MANGKVTGVVLPTYYTMSFAPDGLSADAELLLEDLPATWFDGVNTHTATVTATLKVHVDSINTHYLPQSGIFTVGNGGVYSIAIEGGSWNPDGA